MASGEPPERPGERDQRSESRAVFTTIPATVFGKYILVARLGRGGMADVLLSISAGPAGFRKLVVIKRLHSTLEEDPDFVQMFEDEARLAARLNHPNVIQTYEVGVESGHHFLAMEYLQGQPLDRVLRRHEARSTPMPSFYAMQVVSDALEGLHYAHELTDFDGTPLNVVHRDISPSNIMLTYDGVVKLVDFGIAKAKTQLGRTDPNFRKGKLAYVAPEQAFGHFDRRSDLFSMGVVLWEAIANRRLFLDHDNASTLRNTLQGDVPRLSSVRDAKHLPEGIEAVVTRALQRDPELRYSTALEMREELDGVLDYAGVAVRRQDLAGFVQGLFEDVRLATETELRQVVDSAARNTPAAVESTPTNKKSGSMKAPSLPPGADRRERKRTNPALVAIVASAVVATGATAAAYAYRHRLFDRTQPPDGPEPTPQPEGYDAAPFEVDDAAPGDANEAIERDPEAFERHRQEARDHFQAQRFAEAAESYRRATVANPAHAGSYAGLGASYLSLGEPDRAVIAYQEAVRLAPTTSGFHAALGRAYRSAGHASLAKESYRRAIELDPRNGAARRALDELEAEERRNR